MGQRFLFPSFSHTNKWLVFSRLSSSTLLVVFVLIWVLCLCGLGPSVGFRFVSSSSNGIYFSFPVIDFDFIIYVIFSHTHMYLLYVLQSLELRFFELCMILIIISI